jgi:hypothetical protein
MRISCAVLILGLLGASAHAGVEIPRGVYKSGQLEEARAEAVKKNKALAFVLSDPGTTCGLCVAATDKAFEKLKSHSVIVFINSEDDYRWADVGPLVVTGLSEKKMGNIIPRAVITSPDMSEMWGQMKYEELKVEGPYRGIKKQVDAILKGEAKAENPPERPIYWPIKGSKEYYIGAFAGLGDKGGLRLKMESNGKIATIPLERLTENCAVLARALAGREPAAKPQPEAGQTPAMESWTGSNGKTLQARFVSLADDKVTLEMEDGKIHTMPLERLAGSSQERARTLQAAKQP